MDTTRTFATYNQLLSIIQNVAPATVAVFDGPQPKFPTDSEFIAVGCDDPVGSGMYTAVTTGDQQWLDLGAFSKEETFTIPCVYVTWDGGDDIAALRALAEVTIPLIEVAIRPDRASGSQFLDGVLGSTGWAIMAIRRIDHSRTDKGVVLHVVFDIACTTRLGGP